MYQIFYENRKIMVNNIFQQTLMEIAILRFDKVVANLYESFFVHFRAVMLSFF